MAGNAAIDRVKAHYKRLADEPKVIRVPEWGEEGDEFIIHAVPLTIAERMKLNRLTQNTIEMAVEIIILKAKDVNGEPYFTREHKQDLMRSGDSEVIRRVAQEIVDSALTDTQRVEEAEGN